MGIPAPWTAVHNTPNKSLRQNVPRRGVVLHHAAMTSLSGLRNLAMGAKQVSATAIIKDDSIELIVGDDRYRPWSLSSAWGDSSFRSVETANESTNGWTISDASHWSLARAVAYWAEQDGFRPHRDGDPSTWTVIGHREAYSIHGVSYATACPGGLDLNLVTKRAQQLLSSEEDDMFEQKDRDRLNNVYAGLFTGASLVVDGKVQKFNYGILPIVVRNQELIASQSGRIAALEEALQQVSVASGGAPIDMSRVEAAARAGAAAAVEALQVPTVQEIADGVNDDAAKRLTD